MPSGKSSPMERTGQVRASVTLPGDHYAELERIAADKKVSVAWVVREAIERYIADQWPLLAKRD